MGIFITYTNIIKLFFHFKLHYNLVSLIIQKLVILIVSNGCLSKIVFTTYSWLMPWKNIICEKKIIKLLTWIQIMCNDM
jgi:hypothetical protein